MRERKSEQMRGIRRIRDYGITIGEMPPGARNAITDVPGVRVGHSTIDDSPVKTGVTAIIPHEGNIFREKLIAACHVFNGFGKSTGLIQVEEMGTLETPILLTNTLSVGTVTNALVWYKLERNPDIGIHTGTVNPVVCECNDGYLSDIRGQHVTEAHVREAIGTAAADFAEGGVGAGTGISCYKLKGGIGSASRVVTLDGTACHVGVLVQTNMGHRRDLVVDGHPVGAAIAARYPEEDEGREKGSVIIVLATDVPLSERQLRRVARRSMVGLSRTGSYIGNGSGEIVVAFSTANRILHYEKSDVVACRMFNENRIDMLFRAVAEATEEAILNSVITAKTTTGRDGHTRKSLADYADLLPVDKG